MIDKLLGSDEEIQGQNPRRHRGGELVEIEDFTGSNATGATSTAGAQAAGNIAQTASENDQDDDGSSSYEEEYENDFHEILEEVVRH